MSQVTGKRLSDVFLERLLDRVDPHQLKLNPDLSTAKMLCGRWIGLRRLSKSLKIEEITRRTGIKEGKLILLEAGQAQAHDLSQLEIRRLSNFFAADSTKSEREWTRKVIGLMLGRPLPDMIHIMDRIINELEGVESISTSPDTAPITNPLILAILDRLWWPQHSYGIVEQLSQSTVFNVTINDATISAYIQQMREDGLISLVDERVDLTIDDQPRPYYQITPLGVRVLKQERQKRLTYNPGGDPLKTPTG